MPYKTKVLKAFCPNDGGGTSYESAVMAEEQQPLVGYYTLERSSLQFRGSSMTKRGEIP
jgi:hypothetical protein